MVAQVGYSMAGRSRDRVTPCVVCTMHVETSSASFLIEPQNQGRRFVSGLASKPLGLFVSGLTSKSLGRFLPVYPQNWWLRFPNLGLKIDSYGLVIWVSKSPCQFLGLSLKFKQTTVYRLRHKTDGRATAWDTRRDLAACFRKSD
jgi:hypothetical protein